MCLDEILGVGEGEKPFVAIVRFVGGQAIMCEGALPALQGHPGGVPVVGQGNNEISAGNPKQLGEDGVEIVEVFQDVGADDTIKLIVIKGQPFDLFEVELDVGRSGDIDTGVLGVSGQEVFEVGAIAADVQDGPLEEGFKFIEQVLRTILTLSKPGIVNLHRAPVD